MALIEVDHVTKQYVKVAKIGVVKKKRTLLRQLMILALPLRQVKKLALSA